MNQFSARRCEAFLVGTAILALVFFTDSRAQVNRPLSTRDAAHVHDTLAAIASQVQPGTHAEDEKKQKQPMSEDVFKNVQVLRGIPVSEFMATMGFIAYSLGETCEYCHANDDSWAGYADDNDAHKQTAREMLRMTFAMNKQYFGGRRELTCYSCHNGGDRPKAAPTTVGSAAIPSPENPDDAPVTQTPDPGMPTVGQVLDKYVDALGGSRQLASLTSFVAKGKAMGYGDETYDPGGNGYRGVFQTNTPVEIFAQAPNRRATIIHAISKDNTPSDISTVYDGQGGWTLESAPDAPVPLLQLIGDELENAKLDAELSFPGQIREDLSELLVGATIIDNRNVAIIQGNTAEGVPVRLYFDAKSGLLIRQVRYTDSALGRNATKIDYSDYREVAGVKMPFHWSVSYLGGRTSFDLSEVRPNVSIDERKFGEPVQVQAPVKTAATP